MYESLGLADLTKMTRCAENETHVNPVRPIPEKLNHPQPVENFGAGKFSNNISHFTPTSIKCSSNRAHINAGSRSWSSQCGSLGEKVPNQVQKQN